jgi:hypothetical protein
MSDKKQSSIDWLVKELKKFYARPWKYDKQEIIKQAKAMHKEEQIDFTKKCLDKALDLDVRTAHSQVEYMYNKIFEDGNKD